MQQRAFSSLEQLEVRVGSLRWKENSSCGNSSKGMQRSRSQSSKKLPSSRPACQGVPQSKRMSAQGSYFSTYYFWCYNSAAILLVMMIECGRVEQSRWRLLVFLQWGQCADGFLWLQRMMKGLDQLGLQRLIKYNYRNGNNEWRICGIRNSIIGVIKIGSLFDSD